MTSESESGIMQKLLTKHEKNETKRVWKKISKEIEKKHLTSSKECGKIVNVPPLSGRGEYLVN